MQNKVTGTNAKTDSKKATKRATSNNSNTSNKENLYQPKKKESSKEEQTGANPSAFSFPDGGWVCSFCQNYNFYGRTKCNRCSKAKTKEDCEGKPQHIIRKELKSRKKNDENNMNNMNKMTKMKLKKQAQAFKVQPVEVPDSDSQLSEGNKRSHAERVGDWVCFSCNNLNFSFRKVCNRCKMSREMQYDPMQFNAMNPMASMMNFAFSGVPQSTPYSNPMDPSQSYPNNM